MKVQRGLRSDVLTISSFCGFTVVEEGDERSRVVAANVYVRKQ